MPFTAHSDRILRLYIAGFRVQPLLTLYTAMANSVRHNLMDNYDDSVQYLSANISLTASVIFIM